MRTVDFDIVMLALPRWDGQYSSTAYSLAKELSRHTRVFYIDNPFTIKDFIKQRNSDQLRRRRKALLRGKDRYGRPVAELPNLISVTPRLVLPINWLPPGGVYDALSGVNDQIFSETLTDIVRTHAVRKFVFINSFNPLFVRHFPRDFSPALSIYHCVDDISKSEYVSRHGAYLEREAVRRADLTLVTSRELMRLKQQDTPRVYYHPNAANVELFQQSLRDDLPKPPELQSIPAGNRIILYMGNICQRLDYELLRMIAEQHADRHLVMVGPLSNDNYRKAGLDKMRNVIFTGRKALEALPAYVKYSDVCIIPFLCIPLTRSIYPLKINEYLSAGKPVVTTNFSEDIAGFAPVAWVSSGQQEFLVNIDAALASGDPESVRRRVEFAARNNWKARAAQLLEIIETNLDKHVN